VKPSILFVDDDPSMLTIVSIYFGDQGYEVATAASGAEAMRVAENRRLDLAIFDIHLANENGMDLLSRFKLIFPALPVILLTGHPENDELLDEALARGASGFMRKQNSLIELGEVMRTYLPKS
jgi:DNA-binding NtrC family response regulator